ncbi:hypothetical protein ACFL6L_03975 [candidate division KSB1 bacterium]
MQKYYIAIVVVALIGLVAFCGDANFGSDDPVPVEIIMTPKVSDQDKYTFKDIRDEKMAMLTPIKDKIKVEFLEHSPERIVSKISGFTDITVDTGKKQYLITGNIEYLIIEQFFSIDDYGPGYIKELEGDYTITLLFDESMPQFKTLLDDEDPEVECDTDADCQDAGFPPFPGHDIKCVDGLCRYVPRNV